MNVTAHILAFQEAEIIRYTLRHYTTFCSRIVLHDAGSTDGTREIAREFDAEIEDWKTDGLDDYAAKTLKQRCVMNCGADWCLVVDADEFFWFKEGAAYSFGSYDAQGLAIVRPHGFEMVSDVFPTTDKQLYDEVKYGARDQKWYGKAVLVAPARLQSIVLSAGCHETWATLKDGSKWSDVKEPSEPSAYLLHCKHLGKVERIAQKYDIQRTRLSARNVKEKWGNFQRGIVHAKEKRAMIMGRLERVIE